MDQIVFFKDCLIRSRIGNSGSL